MEVRLGCCGAFPRSEITPPQTGSPDNHKANILWFLGFILFYLGTASLVFFNGAWGNFVFYPLCFMTAFIIYWCCYSKYVSQHKINPQRTRLWDLFRAFSQSFFSAGILAYMLEMVISMIILILVATNSEKILVALETEDYTDFKSDIRIHIYLLLQSFCVAGLIEELCKGFILQYVMKLYIHHRIYLNRLDIETIVWLGLCVGLGFGTMEGVLYVCIAGGTSSFIAQFIIWIIRVFIAIPFHTITGFMWGCEFSKRDALKYSMNLQQVEYGNNNVNVNVNVNNNNNLNIPNECCGCSCSIWFKLGIKQILWHGFYDFVEMEFSLLTYSTNEGTEIIMALIGCVIALIIAGSAGYAAWRTYKRIMSQDHSELVPDIENDNL